jgi:hypothetical protein
LSTAMKNQLLPILTLLFGCCLQAKKRSPVDDKNGQKTRDIYPKRHGLTKPTRNWRAFVISTMTLSKPAWDTPPQGGIPGPMLRRVL